MIPKFISRYFKPGGGGGARSRIDREEKEPNQTHIDTKRGELKKRYGSTKRAKFVA